MPRLRPSSRIPKLLLAVLLFAVPAVTAQAGGAEDDLQVVRKAVLASATEQARPPAEAPAPVPEAKPRPRNGEPAWLRVRVVEKASRRTRVSVNLPIGFVRALGDDWPLPAHHGCHGRGHCGATLGEVLRALERGQNLVEIDDDQASVRVWVE